MRNSIYDIEKIKVIAKQNGWSEIDHQKNIGLLSFTRMGNGKERINIYYTRGTVGTCLEHPKQGKTQLFRKNVNYGMLARLLEKPRLHTRIGYKRR